MRGHHGPHIYSEREDETSPHLTSLDLAPPTLAYFPSLIKTRATKAPLYLFASDHIQKLECVFLQSATRLLHEPKITSWYDTPSWKSPSSSASSILRSIELKGLACTDVLEWSYPAGRIWRCSLRDHEDGCLHLFCHCGAESHIGFRTATVFNHLYDCFYWDRATTASRPAGRIAHESGQWW